MMNEPRYYTPDELAATGKDELQTIADARGLDVTGTGADGKVLVGDLVQAITEDQDRTGINPARAPEPEPPKPRTYKVVGPRRVLNTDPGKTFTAILPPNQEAHLIEAGHIRPVQKGKGA